MKKISNVLVLVAAAAMGFTACQKEIQEEVSVNEGTVQVTFVSGTPDTKTSVDVSGETPVFAWGEDEQFVVLEQTDELAEASSVAYEKVDGKAKITATFGAGSYVKGATMYQYVTIYPASGYVDAESLAAATLSLPAEQTMATGSYDPAADLMVSTISKKTERPTEAQMVEFTRLAAVAKMTLKNFALESGDEVEQVIFTAEGKNLAGTITANLADPHKFEVADGKGVDNVTVNTSSSDVYFTVLPTVLEEGDAYTVTVITKKKLYIKKGNIGEGKSLRFEAGMVTLFGADMATADAYDKWVLVKDVSTIKTGDVVTFVAKNSNYVAGAFGNSSYAYRLYAATMEAVKFGDYLYHSDNKALGLTVLKRDSERDGFDFYLDDGVNKGFLFAPGNNNSPKLQPYCDVNSLFDVTIDDDGVATVIATDCKLGSCKQLMYNTSKYFYCYSDAPTDAKKMCLYKHAGEERSIPIIAANVKLPTSAVVISEDETAEATAISTEQVTFNYVGDWSISVSDNADWLDVTYDSEDNCLKYTAQKNTDEKRDAQVTITATLDGQDDITFGPFTVIQKGAPKEITIAEFGQLSKDENQPYKLTGKVVTLAENATTKGYVLADGEGKQAQINYLDTEAGENVWGHDDLELEIGDIVTVTTYAQGSSKGGSSSLPSIYKGHYRLAVTAGVAAEYTGGDVTITVETSSNGTMTAPETIEGTMAECDYATFSYSGGNTATVTFTSENTTSYAREAEVTFTCGDASVTVVAQQGINPANKLGYELVTDASTLAVGDEVIIVTLKAEKALACPTSTTASSFPVAEIVKSGKVIYDIEETNVQVFTLGSGLTDGTKTFDFTYGTTGYRLYDSSNKLKMRATSYATNASTSWTISINEGDGGAIITSTDSSPYLIKFNSTTGTSFTLYQSGTTNGDKAENAVCIYKKQTK